MATPTPTRDRRRRAAATTPHRNAVLVTGRLSTPAEERELPSGELVVAWRLVVERPANAARPGYDVIDCAAFGARIRRAARGWEPGATVQVEGALRRRFWRNERGTASRYEIEATSAKRLA